MADLTTVTAVKQYLSIKTDGSDALIQRLIPAESRLIEKYTGRKFPFVANVGKRLNGTGSDRMMLPDSPVIAIQSLSVNGSNVPVAPDWKGTGYLIDESMIYLAGGQRFPMGHQNIECSWTAGYHDVVAEVIPSGNVPTLMIVDPGSPSQVNSIASAAGVVFTLSANAPAVGQYQFIPPNLVFNAADIGTAIVVDMYFIPAAVEQACVEMVGLDLKQRDNLGIKSKTLANESITYDSSGLTTSVKEMLQAFRKTVPV